MIPIITTATVNTGATGQTFYLMVVDSSDGDPHAGLLAADFAAAYCRNYSGTPAPISLINLDGPGDGWTSSGICGVTNTPGLYRLDVPNAAFASGVERVVILLQGPAGTRLSAIDVTLRPLVAGVTETEALRRLGAITSGEASGVGTIAETYPDWQGNACVVVNADVDGNRTTVTFF